jgi:ABC-type nitrate/sulfonate/bicarbonate transport system substrate-binding protein
VDRRGRERILGQWGVREPTEHERAPGRQVARDLQGSPVAGRPLRLRARPFRVSADAYVTSLGGPLPYMVRLREIDRLTAAAARELERRWRELAAECAGDPAAFARRWRREAGRHDFGEVNELIARHNRWYPTEARLPMDVRRRDYVLVAGEHYARRPLDAAWVLECLPPELSAPAG